MRRIVIGVMGAGDEAEARDVEHAYILGGLLAAANWVVLCGGRDAGVMNAVCRGARERGGTTVGVLPTAGGSSGVSEWVEIAIFTGMGQARNNINVLSSDAVVACGKGGAGTASEIALAIKAGKPLVLLGADARATDFFRDLGARHNVRVLAAADPAQAVGLIDELLSGANGGDDPA